MTRIASGGAMRALRWAVPAVVVATGAALFGVGHASAPVHAQAQLQASVTMTNFMYDPEPLNIAPGTVVTWTNEDTARHSATDDNGAFDTQLIAKGQSASIEFDYPGTYTYTCVIHPFMHGTINVSGGATQQMPQ